jgi:hypothetical protein
VTLLEEVRLDSTVSVGHGHVDNSVEDSTNIHTVNSIETSAQNPGINPLGESDTTRLGEPDGTSVDAEEWDIIDAAEESGNPKGDSPGKADDTIVVFGESDNMTLDAAEEPNNTTLSSAVQSENMTAKNLGDLNNTLDVPGEAMDLDPTPSGYDADPPSVKNRVQPDITEAQSMAAEALHMMSQYHDPQSSSGFGSWDAVNRPKVPVQNGRQRIDPKELLNSWNWVFQSRDRQAV